MYCPPKLIIPATLLVCLSLMLFLCLVNPGEAGEVVTRKKLPYGNLPEQFRNALEQQDLLSEPSRRRDVDVEPVPWLSPAGEQLVAFVEDRFMTRTELQGRADLFLADRPQLEDPVKAQDRRILTESRLLADWVKIAALAHHSSANGFTVGGDEVEEALAGLTAGGMDGSLGVKQGGAIQGIGIQEDELRREIRDSILVEKLVNKLIEENMSDRQMFRLFKAKPLMFLEPTRVSAWHLYFPIRRRMLDSERRASMKMLEKYRKKLSRCRKTKHYRELGEIIAQDEGVILQEMGWVEDDDDLPAQIKDELFSLDPGKTGEIVKSGPGYHVIKVVDREEGEPISFEKAKPRINAMLFGQYKDLAYEGIKGRYRIYRDASGLNKWVPVSGDTDDVIEAPDFRISAEPDLRLLRQNPSPRKLYKEESQGP